MPESTNWIGYIILQQGKVAGIGITDNRDAELEKQQQCYDTAIRLTLQASGMTKAQAEAWVRHTRAKSEFQ